MTDYDVQTAIEALRLEFQKDRWQLHENINSGFDRISDKLDDHNARIADLEAKQRTVIGTLVTVATATVGSIIAWIFGR